MSDPGITPDELDEIAARAAVATPGPWKASVEGRDHDSGSDFIMTSDGMGGRGEDIEPSGATLADLDFIAHAREDVPRLVLEVLRLRSLLGL